MGVTISKTEAQVTIGLGAGTEWLRLEAGYSITENTHVGVQISPGLELVGIPSFHTGFIRYTFNDNEFGGSLLTAAFRGYVGGSLGLIRSGRNLYASFTSQAPRYGIGISGNAGVEVLYGSSGKFGSYLELNLGQVPNYYNAAYNYYGNLINGSPENVRLAATWGFGAGIRFYFRKN